MAGRTIGRWTVLGDAGLKNGNRHWLCRCSCGTEKPVNGESLRRGDTHSCGCARKNHLIHGHSPARRKTREYAAWANAKERCYNPNVSNYHRYGGRGITMCDDWRHDFGRFLADMGPCPSGLSLDRINNDGPYDPGNCRWATRLQQNRNKSKRKAA